ncbi:phosphotransferase [Kitasatospora sp. NPDC006697]|uniref:phosphotransferase n=1 Tax=Kitasatospora sp. NPDC006697 TaxID=3364020 RepID=UPI0036D00816
MTERQLPAAVARVGSAAWVGEALAAHWAVPPEQARPVPFANGTGAPLSHTAGLWRIVHQGRDHVFKVQLTAEAARAPRFHELKQQVLAHCLRAGVPVPLAVPTVTGAAAARQDGHPCELLPLAPGAATARPSAAQARAVTTAGLRLRAVLDGLPAELAEELAPLPVPALVAEPDWRRALADGVDRLLPLARSRDDPWGRLAGSALAGLAAARPWLPAAAEPPGTARRRSRVIHADLHHHHFLFAATGRPAVTAVLDFDNLTVGDPLLDLAWVAETAARVDGGAARRESVADFLTRARNAGLLAPGEERLLMPRLIVHAVPVVVDIAKDILERELLSPAWAGYLDLLDTRRRLALHRLLTSAVPDPHAARTLPDTDLPRTDDDR